MKIMFAAIRTRPDILYYCSVLASQNKNPTLQNYDRLITILKYLHGTADYALIYKANGELLLNCYVDASFNCHQDAKGHSGYVIYPDGTGSSGILYKSLKQKRVADSSTEAELMSLHEAVQYLIYLSNIYEEIGYKQTGIPVYADNKATIHLSSNEQINFKGKSKFINRKYFGVHQYVEDGSLKLVYCNTEKNVSDFLTKALFGNKFLRFRIDIMGTREEIIHGEYH